MVEMLQGSQRIQRLNANGPSSDRGRNQGSALTCSCSILLFVRISISSFGKDSESRPSSVSCIPAGETGRTAQALSDSGNAVVVQEQHVQSTQLRKSVQEDDGVVREIDAIELILESHIELRHPLSNCTAAPQSLPDSLSRSVYSLYTILASAAEGCVAVAPLRSISYFLTQFMYCGLLSTSSGVSRPARRGAVAGVAFALSICVRHSVSRVSSLSGRRSDVAMVHGGRILSLELLNFKSYRGLQSIGPFRNFTAVVGPNGAGKSNVMDALSFVLGVRTEQLRGKLKELLYNEPGRATDRGHVKMTVQESDGGRVEFSRVIVPQGSYPEANCVSEYRIDEEPVSLEAYLEKLQGYGVLVRARNFLVFQVRGKKCGKEFS